MKQDTLWTMKILVFFSNEMADTSQNSTMEISGQDGGVNAVLTYAGPHQ